MLKSIRLTAVTSGGAKDFREFKSKSIGLEISCIKFSKFIKLRSFCFRIWVKIIWNVFNKNLVFGPNSGYGSHSIL